ncbi:MAG: VOC family protein [Acidimicrobiia bacterium]|nr:VOC family protein [Acidimicrobiia bacterium]
MIDGLAGVLVFTSKDRFPEMRDFYVDVLGLTPRSDRFGFVNFEFGTQRLTVAVHSELAEANRDPLHIMINLRCNDVESAYAAAMERGAAALRPPQSEKWGGKIATLQDPDGNIVQLMQLP